MKPQVVVGLCVLVATASLVAALAGCSARDSPDGSTISRLIGSRWVLVDVAGVSAIPLVEATLEFPRAGELVGNNSCNGFGGKYNATDTDFRVSDLMQTLIGCEPAIAAQEMRYMGALGDAQRLALEGEELRIYCEGFPEPLRFRRASPAS